MKKLIYEKGAVSFFAQIIFISLFLFLFHQIFVYTLNSEGW